MFLAVVKGLKMMKNGVKKYSHSRYRAGVFKFLFKNCLHIVGTLNVTWNGCKPNFRVGVLLSTHRIMANTPES